MTHAVRELGNRPLGIRLWSVDLDLLPASAALLSASEQDRAARFVFDVDRRRYVAAHYALRSVLAAELGLAAGAELDLGTHGKPRLAAPAAAAFNLSHSGATGLIGLAPSGEIGVDIEVMKPIDDIDALAAQNFTAAERAEVRSARDETAALRAFLAVWTRKEACLKALGSGLSIPPEVFEVGLHAVATGVSIPTPEGIASVVVESIELGHGAVAAVARVLAADPVFHPA